MLERKQKEHTHSAGLRDLRHTPLLFSSVTVKVARTCAARWRDDWHPPKGPVLC